MAARAASCGIATGYHDHRGAWVQPPPESIEALIDVIGAAAPETPSVEAANCHWEEGLRTWGWAAQLFALRSRTSWGIGDFSCLATLVDWTVKRNGLVMMSPLTAGSSGPRKTDSPYFPSSRMWLDPIHLDVTEVPGFELSGELGSLAEKARGFDVHRVIDRDQIWAVKGKALELLWSVFRGDQMFDRFKKANPHLESYATYCSMSESFGERWRMWPTALRSPLNSAVAEFRQTHADRVDFHSWLQWLADDQLAGASGGLITDLAVGIDPSGADAWLFGSQILDSVTIGAPPDEFNTQGQNWQIASFHPSRILASDGEAFRLTVAAAMRHAKGMRIDHVMGLFRLYLIPEGASPGEGTYVTFPHEHLLGWLASQSQEHSCFVVGEDLGTVQPIVRESMRRRRMLAYRVMLSSAEPESYPRLSVGAVTTHDLPTIAGLVTGSDLEDQLSLGLEPNVAATQEVKERFVARAASTDPIEVAMEVYRDLARSPSAVVVVTFQDALGIAQRPNMPGTVDVWPNWCLPLPLPIDEILESEDVGSLVGLLSGRPAMPR